MDIFKINGPVTLSGEINVNGSKNAALPIMAAALLASGKTILKKVPKLADITVCQQLLQSLGANAKRLDNNDIEIDATEIDEPIGHYDIVRKMRASICILGPLLARCKKAKVSMPGGCAIGDRPVDIHIKGLKQLGAEIHLENGYIVAKAPKGLVGAEIFLGGHFGSTVLGTANVLMAAVLAKGKTIIEAAACEPEITDLANCLKKMGAKIAGIGSPRLIINGVTELRPVEWTVIPDRIEAGTFMAAAAATKSNIKINNCQIEDMMAVVEKLRQMGVEVEKNGEKTVEIAAKNKVIKPVEITTWPYPGFPTDLQAQFMAVLAVAEGNSIVIEKVFPDRFMHVAEMSRMAAKLRKEGAVVVVNGTQKLMAAEVMASDLRASAALVIAAMAAEGETVINRVYHIDRGYEKIEKRLNAVGANIVRQSV